MPASAAAQPAFTLPKTLTPPQLIEQAELRLQSAELRARAARFDIRAAAFDALIDGEPSDQAAQAELRHAEQESSRLTRELALLRMQVRS